MPDEDIPFIPGAVAESPFVSTDHAAKHAKVEAEVDPDAAEKPKGRTRR